MNNRSSFGNPVDSRLSLNSKSLFHDFVRPRGQLLSSKLQSSPFKGSPQPENLDFIPLSYSSPINNNKNRGSGGRGNWKSNNRRSFVGSPASSSNSSFSPYNMGRKQFHNSANSNCSPNFSPRNDMDRSRNFHSNRKKWDNNSTNNNDISLYYHPSMLEDPWAELEQKLRNQTTDRNSSPENRNTLEKSVSCLSNTDSVASVSDSDEGIDSQETDSISLSDGSS